MTKNKEFTGYSEKSLLAAIQEAAEQADITEVLEILEASSSFTEACCRYQVTLITN